MANGPLGGNMGTPPVPPQPPQVNFETTAQSRGNFNNFLKSISNATAMTPPISMGSAPMMPAPDPMANIDIFNQPVNMRLGGVASNPLDSYGDYLSQQIDNTQVEPFIQEVQQMASQRFNLNGGGGSGGQSVFGPLKTFDPSQPLMEIAEPLISPSMFQRVPQQPPEDLSRPGDLSRPLETAGEPLLSIFDSGINGFRPFNPPQIQDTMARPVDPLKDKNGILREPMGLRGGPNMFNMIDQRIFNEGFTPGSTQLMGGSPRAFFDGGEVDDSDFGGFSDYGSVDATSDDGFSEDNDVSDYSTDDSGVYTGGDDSNQDIAFPTPRPEILQEAIARAENEVFGGTEADALGFINKDGSLTDAGQKEYDSSIMANLDVLQDERPADTGTQLASIFDNKDTLTASAKNVNPADIVQASFRPSSLNSTFSNDVLDGLDLNTAFGQNKSFVESQPDGALKNTIFDYVPDAFQISNFLSQRGNQAQKGIAPVGTQGAGSRGDVIQSMPQVDSFGDPSRVDPNVMTESAVKTGTGQIAGMDENTFRSLSDEAQQQILNDIRDADMGTTFTPYDPEPNRGIVPDTALETMAGRIGPVDTVFDIDTTTREESRVGDDFDTALTLADRNEADRLAAEQAMGVGTAPNLQNLTSSAMGRGIKPFEPPPIVAPGIEAPKEFIEPFKNAGIGAIPTLTSLANKFSNYSRGRVLDSIAQKGYTPVYDGDVIVGSKDKFGNLMEGMDPNAPMGSDDNNENPFVIKPKPEEEKEEEDKPPNVIGGGDPLPVPETVPTVVDSPFTSNVSDFVPSTFNTGDINKLIEMLTGVAAPKSMKKGGVAGYAEGGKVMQALDNLLATA